MGFVCFLNVREELLLSCSEHGQGFRHFRAHKVSLAPKQDDHITCFNSATLTTVLQLMQVFTLNPSFLSPNRRGEQSTKLNSWLKLTSKYCAASSNCQSILHISKTHFPHTPVWTGKATLDPPAQNNNVMLTNLIFTMLSIRITTPFSASVRYICMIFLFAIISV